METLDAEMDRATRQLVLARRRMSEHMWAYGAVDRDLERRLRDALRQVRWLETTAAAALLVA